MTIRPLGKWRMRTAELVLLRFCPPGPRGAIRIDLALGKELGVVQFRPRASHCGQQSAGSRQQEGCIWLPAACCRLPLPYASNRHGARIARLRCRLAASARSPVKRSVTRIPRQRLAREETRRDHAEMAHRHRAMADARVADRLLARTDAAHEVVHVCCPARPAASGSRSPATARSTKRAVAGLDVASAHPDPLVVFAFEQDAVAARPLLFSRIGQFSAGPLRQTRRVPAPPFGPLP